MGTTSVNVSGLWKPVKKIYVKVNGSWYEAKKVFAKVSGVWQQVHTGAYEYVFTADAYNVNLSTLIGSTALNANTEFNIIVNSGVTVYGTVGTTGATGWNGSMGSFEGKPGGTGGSGSPAFNLSGISAGKIIKFINNGIIRGGNGGTGGKGGDGYSGGGGTDVQLEPGGAGGAGGAGSVAIYNPNGASVTVQGNAVINGVTGATGATGATGYFYYMGS